MFVYLKIYLESYHPITVTIIFWLKLSHTSYPCSRGRNYTEVWTSKVGYHRVPPQVCLSQMTYKAIHGLALWPHFLQSSFLFTLHSHRSLRALAHLIPCLELSSHGSSPNLLPVCVRVLPSQRLLLWPPYLEFLALSIPLCCFIFLHIYHTTYLFVVFIVYYLLLEWRL